MSSTIISKSLTAIQVVWYSGGWWDFSKNCEPLGEFWKKKGFLQTPECVTLLLLFIIVW